MDVIDVAIIGAGFHGLVAATTYLKIHPEANLGIFDSSPSVGGLWYKYRNYPGLKTNNMLGTYEFPDFPMAPQVPTKSGEHIEAPYVLAYLSAYASHNNLQPHLRLSTKVLSAERDTGSKGWVLKVESLAEETAGSAQTVRARKLIVATGMMSDPLMPSFRGSETFDAPVIHSSQVTENWQYLEAVKKVTVLGGNKSAWDAVYALASKGVPVDWVIRESGHGPVWMAPPYVTPAKKWLEKLVNTRLLTLFSPCPWGHEDGHATWRHHLHTSTLGRALTKTFWNVLGSDVTSLNNYDAHPETAKLKPWYDAFYADTKLSILNYKTDFFALVRDSGLVKIHIADVESLGKREVALSGGMRLETDALICATGWKHNPPFAFLPSTPSSSKDLGIPTSYPSSEKPSSAEQALIDAADREIFRRFPVLSTRPVVNQHMKPLEPNEAAHPELTQEPYNLYRFMVPPKYWGERDVAFAGALSSLFTPVCAQMQALWITAYFDGKLVRPGCSAAAADAGDVKEAKDLEEQRDERDEEMEKVRWETVLHNRYFVHRYPEGYQSKMPDFVFDAMPYVDMLLQDLGLEKDRKNAKGEKEGWLGGVKAYWRDMLMPYGPEDYRGLVEEWKGLFGGGKPKGERAGDEMVRDKKPVVNVVETTVGEADSGKGAVSVSAQEVAAEMV